MKKKFKILTVVGARPQIIKAAAISRAIRNSFSNHLEEIIVHSGQHYDNNMSKVFFEELNIPTEKYNLRIGSGSHAEQSAKIMLAFDEIIEKEMPDGLLLYGDTNSTLATALVAAKKNIPIFHIEGGLRMYDKSYPEEINRRLTDHLSTLIFVPSDDGIKCLKKEGFDLNFNEAPSIDNPKIVRTGDIMFDNALFFSSKDKNETISKYNLNIKPFGLITLHRHTLSDNPQLLQNVFDALDEIIKSHDFNFILPAHPRIQKIIPDLQYSKELEAALIITNPLSYTQLLALEQNCQIVLTDSGGVQKEAYFFKKPCLILLNNTPWVELISGGTSRICSYDKEKIVNAFNYFIDVKGNLIFDNIYGNGKSSEFICNEIVNYFMNYEI